MELTKTKYKLTTIGLIPEDWEVVDIGSQCQIFGRIGFRGYTVNDIVKEDQGAITLSPSNIVNGQLDLKKVTYLSWYKYEESPEIKIFNGDILLVKTGSTYGKTALVKNLNEKATLNPQIVVLKKTKCNNAYLGYMMGFPIVQNQIEASVVGGAIPTLSQEQVSRFKIPLPPTLTEQKTIATALSDVDALISSLERLITKKKAIKQGAMQELLTPPQKGGKRLSGFSREWEEQDLENLCWYQEGPGLRKWQFTEKGIKVINITNLVGGYLNLDKTTRHISWYEFNKMYQHFEIDEGDIVVASSGNSYCKTSVVRKQDLPLVMNTSVIRFKPNENLDYKLLLLFLKSNLFKDQIDLLITGGAQPNFGPAHLKKIKLFIPKDIEEQKAIANILSDMDLEIEALETKKAKYQEIKQGMMQELLTGKTRLV